MVKNSKVFSVVLVFRAQSDGGPVENRIIVVSKKALYFQFSYI